MDKYTRDQISQARKLLGNQYAFIEYLDEIEVSASVKPVARPPTEAPASSPNPTTSYYRPNASNDPIRSSRELLQNPYAYLNDEGTYSAEGVEQRQELQASLQPQRKLYRKLPSATNVEQPSAEQPRRYSEKEIQDLVRELQAKLWRNRKQFWGEDVPNDPVDLLDPYLALHISGYDVEVKETLGQFRQGHKTIEVAGLLDNANKKVELSRQFNAEIMLFTAAHELGHTMLHGNSSIGLHRDRALDGTKISRDNIEWAADKFAVYFLMPEKLLRKQFKQRFLTDLFQISEATAFALSGNSISEIRDKFKTKRELSRFLAGAEQYNGRRFKSLANHFKVSVETMAIRLEELELIAFE